MRDIKYTARGRKFFAIFGQYPAIFWKRYNYI